MGMAASQARLLTITSRLNHVELEAQNVSNAKIRLSDKTQAASDEYIAALNKTEYLYNYYDGSGEKISMSLTGSALTTYGELKNQYGLINSAGQILVSETDANNYETSNTLEEFLEKYGVLGDLGTGDKIEVANPEYDIAMDDYNKEYDEWLTKKPDPNDPIYQIAGSEFDLYEEFTKGTAGGCYTTFMNPCGSGYLNCVHACDVLEHMLELGEHTTSDGEVFEILASGRDYESHWWTGTNQDHSINNVGGDPEIMAEIRKEIEGKYACGKGHDPSEGTHYMDCPEDWDGCGGKHEMDCTTIEPCDGEQLLVDKIEDLYYAFKQEILQGDSVLDLNDPYEQDLYNQMVHLVEHDLKQALSSSFDKEAYNDDLAAWEVAEPEKPDVPQFIEKEVRKITDLDKAQWYVNLWHRMNGTSDYRAGVGGDENFIAGDGWASKSTTDQSYAVLKDGEMNSSEYLKFAIENGIITLEQVQFVNPSKSEEGIENIEWTSIVFGSAQDITEQKDQEAITKAEVKYEQAQREIQAKDKEYETQLKKLDTEHNALQTEYDSIKSVIEKNVERGFKVFS